MIRIEAIGNLTRDPETRIVQKGETDGKVTNFTLAASVGYGEYKKQNFSVLRRGMAWVALVLNSFGKAVKFGFPGPRR